MSASFSETVLQALFAALEGQLGAGVGLMRNASLPQRIPAAGIAILFDGEPGDPETLLSPLTYIYEHRAELDVVVEGAEGAERDARFDAIKKAVGVALAADRTLGGLCDWVEAIAPSAENINVDGAEGMKAATIGIVLTYGTSDPLL